MRSENPTYRWLKHWERAHASHGGWDGPATIKALRPRAITLYRLGASAEVAGAATAREWGLHSALHNAEELAHA